MRVRPAVAEVSEEGPQRAAHRPPGCRAPVPGVSLDVTDDVFLLDLAEVAGAGRTGLAQEPANSRSMDDDGPRRQPAFLSQIICELLEYPFLGQDRWR